MYPNYSFLVHGVIIGTKNKGHRIQANRLNDRGKIIYLAIGSRTLVYKDMGLSIISRDNWIDKTRRANRSFLTGLSSDGA